MTGYCHHCNNTGWLDCYCGGDLCICENNGEEPCWYCEGDADDEFYAEEAEAEKIVDVGDELHSILGEALAKTKGRSR